MTIDHQLLASNKIASTSIALIKSLNRSSYIINSTGRSYMKKESRDLIDARLLEDININALAFVK